jgi:hypothetical protein
MSLLTVDTKFWSEKKMVTRCDSVSLYSDLKLTQTNFDGSNEILIDRFTMAFAFRIHEPWNVFSDPGWLPKLPKTLTSLSLHQSTLQSDTAGKLGH